MVIAIIIYIFYKISDTLPLTRSPLSHRKKRAADVKTSNNERKQFSADRVGRRLTAYACEDSRLNICLLYTSDAADE